MENSKSKKKDWWLIMAISVALLFVIGAWLITYYSLRFDFEKFDDRGTFGDMFGSVNALFSGLAFAGIIITIFLQSKELRLQRNELNETKKEFQIQNKTLTRQRFENTFFNLLNLHHQIVENIDKTYSGLIAKGRDVFLREFNELNNKLVYKRRNSQNDCEISISSINTEYLKYYRSVQTDFGHYFRNLYRIFKFINDTEFFTINEIQDELTDSPSESKLSLTDAYELRNYAIQYSYTSMVRAQLSDYELLWLFYNCLSDNGYEKFKPLIEKYTLFKNLPFDKLLYPELKDEFEPRSHTKDLRLSIFD